MVKKGKPISKGMAQDSKPRPAPQPPKPPSKPSK